MKWLNIEIATLRSPKYIGAEPIERATWLSLLGYCADQENGGRIVGCIKWKDRTWQQVCGITQAEASIASNLYRFDGDDLLVEFYPLEKEAELRAKRKAGSKGGKASGKARREAELEAVLEAELEGKGKGKGKGNVKERELAQSLLDEIEAGQPKVSKRSRKPPEMSDDDFVASLINDPAYEGIDVRREAAKWARWCELHRKQTTRKRLVAWLNRVDRPMLIDGKHAPAPQAPARVSVWEAKEKKQALLKKIDSIKSNWANKRQSDDSFALVLKPEAKAEIETLRAKIKALDSIIES
jgi:hypothetical protein